MNGPRTLRFLALLTPIPTRPHSVTLMLDSTSTRKASVIIVTGFLGSGKTTLINRILTADHGRKIAVIVNEFGEVGIDHHLLLSSDQEVVQMNNGCVCCTVRGDLMRSLFQLMEHREKFDTVVIETTGLAEPAPVAQSLYGDEQFRREFTLDGVVTVVDRSHSANVPRCSGGTAGWRAVRPFTCVS